MPAKVYTDKDANPAVLRNKTLAVLGFGSQGHAHALNLKESGYNVIIGLYEGSKSIPLAEEKGFQVFPTAEAVRRADVIFVAIPDTKQPAAYERDIKPNLTKGKTLLFSHGFAIHFKTVVPPKNVDVILVAPKGPGHIVRRQYTEGKGVPALIAVYRNASGNARKVALAWARGIGGTRAGVLETSFKEETETDLFGEQTVLCGGASALVQAGFETLVEAGYAPEMAYFECLHELKLIVDMFDACTNLRDKLSAKLGVKSSEASFADGRIAGAGRSDSLGALAGTLGIEASGEIKPGEMKKKYSQAAYGAHFAEVAVDRDTGEIRLRRMLGVFAAGRILNEKMAKSQAVGAMIWGVGSALHEDAIVDERHGCFVNHDLAEYHVPSHADIPAIEAHFLPEVDDKTNPLKIKGVGELGICGAGAAIANAVYNACGVRIREFPLTLDKVLAGMERQRNA